MVPVSAVCLGVCLCAPANYFWRARVLNSRAKQKKDINSMRLCFPSAKHSTQPPPENRLPSRSKTSLLPRVCTRPRDGNRFLQTHFAGSRGNNRSNAAMLSQAHSCPAQPGSQPVLTSLPPAGCPRRAAAQALHRRVGRRPPPAARPASTRSTAGCARQSPCPPACTASQPWRSHLRRRCNPVTQPASHLFGWVVN